MEGFMSTTMDVQIMRNFSNNCEIKIVVKKENLHGPLDNGFAFLS